MINIDNRDKPSWNSHNYAAICMRSNSNWYGLHNAEKPFYSNEWKGKEVSLLRTQADFLKRGINSANVDIECMYEVRPINA